MFRLLMKLLKLSKSFLAPFRSANISKDKFSFLLMLQEITGDFLYILVRGKTFFNLGKFLIGDFCNIYF